MRRRVNESCFSGLVRGWGIAALGLLGVAALACGALIGYEELPEKTQGPDGGTDGPTDPPADAGARVGTLDPTFGDKGIAVVERSDRARSCAVVVDGEDLVLVAEYDDLGALLVARCTATGVCDMAHAASLAVTTVSRMIPVPDPRGNGALVAALEPGQHSPRENDVHLWHVARDGTVVKLFHGAFSAPTTQLEFAFAAGASRYIFVDNSETEDAGRLNLRAHLPDGGADLSFGPRGTRAFVPQARHLDPRWVLIQDDGRIVVLGRLFFEDSNGWLRFEPDGGLDRSFGTDGGAGGSRIPVDLLAMTADDGGFLFGGRATNDRGLLVRVTPDGRLDPSFGSAGMYRFESTGDGTVLPVGEVRSVARTHDGAILSLGIASVPETLSTVVVLSKTSGTGPDPSFGRKGQVLVDEGNVLGPASMVLRPDGKAVITWVSADGLAKLARYFVE